MLLRIALAELLGMCLWFTASAVAPHMQRHWGLAPSEVAWLSNAVPLGFVIGTALSAVLNLADLWDERCYFAGACACAALCNALVPLCPGFPQAVVLRGLTGFFLAGVYPPAMKLVATWFRQGRGLAIGAVVAALTVGKATPHVLHALGEVGRLSWSSVLWLASAAAVGASLIMVMTVRPGPHTFERRPFFWGQLGEVLGHGPTLRAVLGYVGHMWELYALWTWVLAFATASLHKSGATHPSWLPSTVAFSVIAVGGLGCLWGGWFADRHGRVPAVLWSLGISGTCCIMSVVVFGQPLAWLLILLLVWGFFVVADSAQFSVMVTESCPSHAVGTALTVQTSIGFLTTSCVIPLVLWCSERFGWRWAFLCLALGPLLGILSQARRRIA